jgi:DNA-binding CsgD family transcriptional regulator
MYDVDMNALTRVSESFTERKHLTPAEHAELLRIAQGYACKDSAAAAGVSPETIRARRKRIYRKLGVSGAGETLSCLLAVALRQLASPGEVREVEARQTPETTVTVH